MGHKIFVSYKYGDSLVASLPGHWSSTVRDYVTHFEDRVDRMSHVFKGESDGEDLSYLSEDGIWEKLKARIYDTSVTIVFISPGMKENLPERYQWIPWEISYSLKEMTRRDRTSRTNAVFSVVLPDYNNSYEYFIHERQTPSGEKYTHYNTDWLFPILRGNMFNRKKSLSDIRNVDGVSLAYGEPSYIFAERWDGFISNISGMIGRALKIQADVNSYDLVKEVSNA